MSDSDSDKSEQAALAKRFLDLWEEHAARLCNDPETMGLLKLSGLTGAYSPEGASPWLLWQQGLNGMMEFWKAQGGGADGDERTAGKKRGGASATGGKAGTEAAAAAPDLGDAAVEQLLDRLAAVERRLAALERKQPSASKPKPRPGGGSKAKGSTRKG
jgi:hypothetical protein